MEKVLGAAKELAMKVESNEGAAGELLKQCESLQQQLKAMRQVIYIPHQALSNVECSY